MVSELWVSIAAPALMSKAAAECLVKLTHTVSASNLKEFLNGERKLLVNDLKLTGKVTWDSTSPAIAQYHEDCVLVVGVAQLS